MELARQHGVYSVAHPLRLDYTRLKKWLGEVSSFKAAVPAFVELIASHPATMSECVIEFESSIGGKMRMQWKGRAPLHRIGQACCGSDGKQNDDPYHGADARAGGNRAGGRTKRDRFIGSRLLGARNPAERVSSFMQ